MLLWLSVGCKAQELNNKPEYFDFANYKNLIVDEEFSSNIHFKENDRKINIQISKNYIAVIETNINNRYGITKTFSSQNHKLLTVCNTFCGESIGILKRFEPNGEIVEVDLDKQYPYTTQQLTKRLRTDFMIDINDKNIGFRKSFINVNGNAQYCYEIVVISSNGNARKLILSSVNGDLISDEPLKFEK